MHIHTRPRTHTYTYTQINNCVVLGQTTIGPNCSISNSVLCAGAVVEEGCNLTDCQVSSGKVVPANTKAKGESFNDTDGMGENDGEGW